MSCSASSADGSGTETTKWNDFDQVGVKADRRCTPDVGFYLRSTELSVITYG